MKRIKLKDKEYNKMSTIIEKYRNIETSFNDIQAQLKTLDLRKEDLLKTLDVIKVEETQFFDKLTKKYGEGKLDLLTLEYITS